MVAEYVAMILLDFRAVLSHFVHTTFMSYSSFWGNEGMKDKTEIHVCAVLQEAT